MVNLEIRPIRITGKSEGYLVLFESSPLPHPESGSEQEPPLDEAGRREIEHIRQELSGTREYLQFIIEEQEATNEELKSANEEILSSNEELQSTNEELQTAKEELQSTNEELTTVNEELNVRNLELTQTNNDLNNLLANVNIPVVMLGSDLRIRRFTPM